MREKSDDHCLMVQGKNSLEVQSDSQIDDSSSSYCYGCLEVQNLNVELATKLEIFLKKHNLLKKKNLELKEEIKYLCSNFELILQEKEEIASERDSLKSQLELALKENEFFEKQK